jgi:hypothetical protein
MPGTIRDSDVIGGTMRPDVFVPPSGSIADDAVIAAANVAYTKLQQQKTICGNQPNTTATTETRAIYVAYGTIGTLLAFKAGSIAIAVGAATVTLDLKKNGTTVLSAPITLDSSNVARVVEAATISVPSFVAGDFFEVVITATAGGGTIPTGLFYELVLYEKPA